MGAQKVVSRKTALGFIGLCIILSVAVIGALVQNSNTNLHNQAASKDLIISSLNSTVSTLNTTVGKDNSTIASLNAQIASLQKQVKSENLVNSALQTQVASTSSQLNSETNEVSTLQNEINTNAQAKTLENELSTEQAQVTTLQNQIASDQSTANSLNARIVNLDSTMANWDSPVQDGFSLIQITDTQFLSKSHPDLFNTLTSWIVNNTNALNVSMVIHTGDIINDPDNLTEWTDANTAMMQLYNSGVPYCWDAGNHDIINESIPQGNTNGIWLGGSGYSAFNVALMQQEPYWVASIFNGTSTAVQFSYGDYRFLVINIAYDANQTVLDWMQTLINCNPNDNVIVATHNFLNGQDTLGFTPSSKDVDWATNFNNTLNSDPNVFMTLSGHDINEGTAANVHVGNREEIFFNRQQQDNAEGGATARIYTFNMSNPGHPTVSVFTYETYASDSGEAPQYLTDLSNQFNFTSNLIPYSPTPVSLQSGTDFLGASGFSTSFSSSITLSPVMQNIQGMFQPDSQVGYNQTGDLLGFYNFTFNGYTSNFTVSTVGANIVINTLNANTISYTVDGDSGGVNGVQTFLLNMPASVTVDGGTAETSPGTNWTYLNGVLTVTGATQSVAINLPNTL
jgi:peptidoglycan hydrolase CwlO-like protein